MQRLIMSLFCLLPFSLSAQTLQFVGTAFAPESRQPIYTERYTEHFSADGKLVTGTVLYRVYDGAALGKNFSTTHITPMLRHLNSPMSKPVIRNRCAGCPTEKCDSPIANRDRTNRKR